MLPGEELPLRIFEPRYTAMISECLTTDDPAFGVVLIAAGREVGGGDVRSDVGAMAHIVEAADFGDGRYRLRCAMGERIRVVEWQPDDPYPRAAVEPWPDEPGESVDVDAIRDIEDRMVALFERIAQARNVLYLGRDIHFPVALEGALKMKEISYIHAEGYPTAEMKHGPIALVDPQTPSIFVAPRGPLHAKTLSNIEEVRARRGPVVSVGIQGDDDLARISDHLLPIPEAPEVIQPLLAVVPLQLLAYHVARIKGCDIDKPRNLAKSVTVE